MKNLDLKIDTFEQIAIRPRSAQLMEMATTIAVLSLSL